MVDRRILPDLRWIASRFPIYVTDGDPGPLPDGEPRRLQRLPRPRLRPLQRPCRRPGPGRRARRLRLALDADHPPRPLGRAGPERTDRRRFAGSATKATPATAAATTCTSPGTTLRPPSSSSPTGSSLPRRRRRPAADAERRPKRPAGGIRRRHQAAPRAGTASRAVSAAFRDKSRRRRCSEPPSIGCVPMRATLAIAGPRLPAGARRGLRRASRTRPLSPAWKGRRPTRRR